MLVSPFAPSLSTCNSRLLHLTRHLLDLSTGNSGKQMAEISHSLHGGNPGARPGAKTTSPNEIPENRHL